LGVRQDYPTYVRHRLPSRMWWPAVAAAVALERSYRRLARRCPVVVDGPDLLKRFAGSPAIHELSGYMVPRSELDRSGSGPRPLSDPIKLLSVGRLEREKAPETMIEMIEILNKETKGRICLDIVGKGDLERALRTRAERQHLPISFLGYIPHGTRLFDIYRRSDLLVHTAHTEALPQVLFEAAAVGLPVVATDVGSVRKALERGNFGVVVPPRDPAALADAVVRVLANEPLRSALSEAGRMAARCWTIEHQAARLAKFLRGDL
jgi:glycosyltransferase involved in cell wall biosynthesis